MHRTPTRHSQQLRTLMLTFLAVSVATNCFTPLNAAEPDKPVEQYGADTPEDAFNTFREALAADDWKRGYKILTTDSQEFLVCLILWSMEIGLGGNEGRMLAYEAADKDQVRDQVQKITREMTKLPRKDHDKLRRTLAPLVKDPLPFLTKVFKLMARRQRPGDSWFFGLKDSKISEVQIDGDNAKATMRSEVVSEPIGFKRLNGKWFVQLMKQ